MFPDNGDWDTVDKLEAAATAILSDPKNNVIVGCTSWGGKTVEGVHNGVRVQITLDQTGKVRSMYPTFLQNAVEGLRIRYI